MVLGLLAGSALALASGSEALAQARPAPAPTTPVSLGKFDDWEAATASEGGARICYVFTRPSRSEPNVTGRGAAVLSVTHRGANRDQVAISIGFQFGDRAELAMNVDQSTAVPFFTRGQAAFSRDGAAAVAAFQKGTNAVTKAAAGPRGEVTDTWSLKGFTAAYRAIGQACAR